MILGIGSDVVNIERIERLLARFGERFETRLFTDGERALAASRKGERIKAATLAKRIAAKEAFVKALGTGFTGGIGWREIEIIHQPGGRPEMKVTGKAQAALQRITPPQGKVTLHLSLTDDHPTAQAFVIIEHY